MRRACLKPRRFLVLVAEKPRAAEKIAYALASRGRVKCSLEGIPYWIVYRDGEVLVVAPSAGHLFGPHTRKRGFPVFEFEWLPIFTFERGSGHLRKFYSMLSKVVPGAMLYVNACDYDVEGSVIGFKIIEAFGDVKRAKRMKFSSLSPVEIRRAYNSMSDLDWNMIEAGMARNEMDWLWGINVSRALMEAARRSTGRRLSLSAGRVQSPTLVEAVRRWEEINLHVPKPHVRVKAVLSHPMGSIEVYPSGWVPASRREAAALRERLTGTVMTVSRLEASEAIVRPPPPFNLGDLQAEASRIYGMPPMKTQSLAEDLYLDALISYPRTNSQKLPPTIDYLAIMRSLASGPHGSLVRSLLSEARGSLKPVQGRKDDPAHPAIHPTGQLPGRLDRDHERIYDLIVRRFLAAFARPARVLTVKVELVDVDGRRWQARGVSVVEEGWMKYYPYLRPGDRELPPLKRGDSMRVARVIVGVEWSQPSLRLDKMGLLRWMENVRIGTESTRARIIELLFKRGYLSERGRRVEVTDLGYTVAYIIRSLFPELATPELTRRFEEMLDDIRRGARSRGEVLAETRRELGRLLKGYLERLPQVEEDIAVALGVRRPRVPCSLCGAPKEGEMGGVALCRRHLEAARRVAASINSIASKMSVDRLEALKLLAGRRSGVWVREVAEAALRHKGLRRAILGD